MEWEEEAENEEEAEGAGRVEEACVWGGAAIGDFGGYAAVSGEDVEIEEADEKIEMIVDSVCRRTIVKPRAFKGMNPKKTDNGGKNFRTADGAHIFP